MTIRRGFVAIVATLAVIVLVFHAVRVEASQLTPILFVLTLLAWLCFAVLGSASVGGTRIGALTERTFIALVIALLGTVACVLAANTDASMPWFDMATSRLLFRMSILVVLTVPSVWLVLWRLNRLGGEPEADHDHRRVGDARDRSHRRDDER